MQLQIKLIEEDEILDDDLEFLDVTAMMAIEEIEKEEKSFKASKEKKPPHTFTEPLDFNATLAEMSIIEGSELLAVGSYEMAIERFREAIKYNPNNENYQTKLSEAIELSKTKNAPLARNMTGKLTSKLDSSAMFKEKPSTGIANTTTLKETQSVAINAANKDIKGLELYGDESLKETQEVSINDTLAEMSFIEANDLLARGDYSAAIDRFREAVKYSPKNSLYTDKLNSILAESKTNKTGPLKPLKEDASFESSKEEKHTKPLKASGKKAQAITKAEKAEIEGPISVNTSSKAKTSKHTFIAIVATMILISIAALTYQFKTVSFILVKQSYPSDQAKLNKQQLEFEWQSTGDRFLFEIEYVGKPIVKAYTEETRYKLTPAQISNIRLNTSYKWKVIPVDVKGEPVPYKTEEKWFEVVQ